MRLPILEITRVQGENALLAYKRTEAERRLFQEMDGEAAKLPESASLDEYHDIVAIVGTRHGLTRWQSIAFWTRTAFSIFEPE